MYSVFVICIHDDHDDDSGGCFSACEEWCLEEHTFSTAGQAHHHCNGPAPFLDECSPKGRLHGLHGRCSLGIAARLSWKRFAKDSDYKLE